ncbi:Cytochrome c1-1 [Hibiscus syriacus]|uniref:Cytochrome c1-1 n=1 Tax=Hibiscus syriacus TaxID=106335 RepID=A0A6A3AQJ1_HIBSY|nr:Cytochrome c1-1 [Hibiscus syriacus]
MRFRKGSKVEVLTRTEVPTGAWRCAEIISGYGHSCSVKYGWFPMTGEAGSVERVPRKVIRPCPPPINRTDDWVPGDVVEVFDELYWKPAVIVRAFGGNNFSVRIIGSNRVLSVHQSRLRVRKSWEDGKWFLVGNGSSNSPGPSKRKRSSPGFSDAGGKKTKVIEKGSIGGQRLIVRIPCPASEKVDVFVSPNNILAERCTPSSFCRIDDTSDTLSCASDADSYSERSCGEEGSPVSTSVELGTDFHRSELHAYQKALGTVHASGPLTCVLCYSNDAAYGINVEKYLDAFSENLMANVGGINTLLLKP